MPKVAFRTLGCRLNQAETDRMAGDLLDLGFHVVPEQGSPDVVVVNTCTVTQEATRSSRRVATRSIKDNPEALVVVAGCYSVAEPEDAQSIPGVGMVVGNDEKEALAAELAMRLGSARALPQVRRSASPGVGRSRVNLKAQTGCDEWCTFCIIPKTRGDLHSSPPADVLAEAKSKADAGAKEIVLTGVHLGKYGWDTGRPGDALFELLEGMLAIDGIARIRLSSILCRHVTPELLSLIRSEDRICRFLHVPLQSGHDEVLKRMNRPYTVSEFLETIEAIEESVPGAALSTDVIVGFPGETEDHFSATLAVAARSGFMKIHAFRYSPRPGTPSADWPDQVPDPVKKQRSKELIRLGNEMRVAFNKRSEGTVREVLVEESFPDGNLAGHTDDFVKVVFAGPSFLKDRLARVRVESASLDSVKGEFVCEVPWAEASPRAAMAAK